MSLIRPWPYAAKAIIHWEHRADFLVCWIIFRYPMDQTVTPANNLFTFKLDGVEEPVVIIGWQDAYTLLMQVRHIEVAPTRVLAKYDGPSEDLRTTWLKQWEPFGWILGIYVPYDWRLVLAVDLEEKLVTINGILLLTSKTVMRGTYNDLDVDGVNILYLNSTTGDIIINGFSNGVPGQVLFMAITAPSANDITLSHENAAGNQKIHLHAMGDETLKNQYGGWNLACLGTHWYDISHAKHV